MANVRLAFGPPDWHAAEIERRVLNTGGCLFWSQRYGEKCAFVMGRNEALCVPADIVTYTLSELEALYQQGGITPLIHEAKRQGAEVLDAD